MRRRLSKRKTKEEIPKTDDATQESHQDTDSAPAEKTPSPPVKNPAAVALGKLGGAKGGAARAKKLTKEQRSEIAKKAAKARWAKKKT